MAFTADEIAHIEDAMADFMEKRRPREEIRDKLDLAYRITDEDESVVIFTIRPYWRDPAKLIEGEIAKARYRRNSARWDILWRRADMKWHMYEPHPEALLFEEFLAVVHADAYCCFWG